MYGVSKFLIVAPHKPPATSPKSVKNKGNKINGTKVYT